MRKEAKQPEKLAFSVSEVAEALGISRTLAYQLVNAPDGPKVTRIGNRILVPKLALEAWLNDRSQSAC